jgi:uncharacterized oligopeptide transporter (OPT) family protein
VEEKSYPGTELPGFTARAVAWGLFVGLIVQVSIYYMYMAMGFTFSESFLAILLAMLFIPIIGGKATKYEVNIAQTTGSAFATSAAVMSTSFIAALQMGYEFNWFTLPVIALLASILGFCVNSLLRRQMLNDKSLIYPESVACAKVIEKVETPADMRLLIIGIVLAFVLTIGQEVAFIIPGNIDITDLLPEGFIFRISLAALPLGIGYILGKKIGFFMLLSALVTNVVFAPVGYSLGWFPNPSVDYEAFSQFNLSAFLGITIFGSAVFMLKTLDFKKLNLKMVSLDEMDNDVKDEVPIRLAAILLAVTVVATMIFFFLVFNVNPLVVFLAIFLSVFLTYVVIRIKEQSGMGVFSFFQLIVLLIVLLIVRDVVVSLLLVSITVGLSSVASDTMTDYKTGHIIGAKATELFKAQLIGLVPGVAVGTVIMYLMIATRGIGTPEAPYVFAQLFYGTAAAISGTGELFFDMFRFGTGMGLGALFGLFGLPSAVIGVAHYLPMEIMMGGGIAGILRGLVDVKWGEKTGQRYINLAGGLILGFSLVIIVVLIVSIFTGPMV